MDPQQRAFFEIYGSLFNFMENTFRHVRRMQEGWIVFLKAFWWEDNDQPKFYFSATQSFPSSPSLWSQSAMSTIAPTPIDLDQASSSKDKINFDEASLDTSVYRTFQQVLAVLKLFITCFDAWLLYRVHRGTQIRMDQPESKTRQRNPVKEVSKMVNFKLLQF